MRHLSCIALLFLLSSCGSEKLESNKDEDNGLAFLVFDRSSSVRYETLKMETIRVELTTGLKKLFISETGYEVIGVHEITASSSVIPRFVEFSQTCTGDKNGNSKEKSAYADCIGKKKQWIRKQVEQALNDLSMPPTAKATDVFGLFRSVDLAIRSGKSTNRKTHVYVFSDMVNTSDNINLNNLNSSVDAAQRADKLFAHLASKYLIKPIDQDNDVHFMILNPSSNVVKTPTIEFWNHFLMKWGVRKENIQWR